MVRASHIAALVILTIFVFSCAKQNNAGPTGGPIDEAPPAVVEANPPDKSINFNSSSFEITFDEFFVLDNISEKLMTSPPFEKKPEVKTKGKTMIVSFEEALRDSVTYSFYFLDAIKDLNEGNAMDNFQYVFSTGPFLDSLTLTGTVYDANTLDPVNNVYVVLYLSHSDTIPRTKIPEYITRATPEGRFRIDNIAEGTYSVYGLIDLNGNKMYDLEDESFAFIDSTITLSGGNNYIPEMPDSLATSADSARYLTTPGKETDLLIFTSEQTEQYLKSSARENAFKLIYTFSQPVDSGQFSVDIIDSLDQRYRIDKSVNRDTIVVWLLDSLFYSRPTISLLTQYPETDSTGAISIVYDTIDFRYLAPRPQRGRAQVVESALRVAHNGSNPGGFKPGQKLIFSFDIPIEEPVRELLKLYMAVDTNRVEMDYNIVKDSTANYRYIFDHNFLEDSTYVLIINKGVFTDIYGNQNDSTGIKIRVRNSDTYGTLTMNLSWHDSIDINFPGYDGNTIVQLISSDGKIIREDYVEIKETTKIFYPLLMKGEYIIKAMFDLNGDKKWTPGDFDLKRQPEPVSFYPNPIEVRVQWDLIQDWKIRNFNYKNPSMRESSSSSRR